MIFFFFLMSGLLHMRPYKIIYTSLSVFVLVYLSVFWRDSFVLCIRARLCARGYMSVRQVLNKGMMFALLSALTVNTKGFKVSFNDTEGAVGGYIKAQYLPLSPHFNEKQDSPALTEPAICVCLFFFLAFMCLYERLCFCAYVSMCLCCVKWHHDAKQHIYGGCLI